jgi:hypothetical protein
MMKKLFLSIMLLFCLQHVFSQVSYYRGEWTMVNKNDLFRGIFKISVAKNGSVKAEIIWTYLAVDSTSKDLVEHYKRKKGKSGIEYAEGQFSRATNDFTFEGKKAVDPFAILGLDKYHIKLSNNKQAIYGTTETQGTNEGLLYAIRLNNVAGKKEFKAAKAKVKKKSVK